MRTNAEIRDLIKQVEEGWGELRNSMRDYEDQLYCTQTYRDRLVAALPEEITTRVPHPSRFLNHDANAVAGILNVTWQYHVEPQSKYVADEKKADKLELYYAYLGFRHIEPLRKATNRMRTVQPFAPWWLDLVPFRLDPDDPDGYRRRYDPIRLSLLDPRTVAAMLDDEGRPTIAVRHFHLPYIDLIKKYGKGKDAQPLEICRQQFPFLRGGSGHAVDNADLYGKRAEVWILDDGVIICHYVKVDDQYHQLGEGTKAIDYPNPWGRPSLVPVWGRYNADAERLEHRLEPVYADGYREARNLDILTSYSASIALTPAKFGEEMPPEAIQQMEDKPIVPTSLVEGQIVPLRGKLTALQNPLDVSMKDILALQRERYETVRPPAILLGQENTVTSVETAAAYLGGVRSASTLYDAPKQYEVDAIKAVCEMVRHWMINFQNKKVGGEYPGAESLYFVPTGMENRKGKPSPEKDELELGPSDFDWDYILEVTPEATDVPTRQANYMLTRQEVLDGVSPPEKLIEAVTEDVQGQIEKLELHRRYQAVGPIIDEFDLIAAVEEIALKEGRDYSQPLMQMLALSRGQEGAPAEGGGNGLVQQTTTAPPVDMTQAGSRM